VIAMLRKQQDSPRGVAAQILQHELRATERRFQVDDPLLSVRGWQAGVKDLRLRKKCEISLEAELAITESLRKGIDKLCATLHNTSWGNAIYTPVIRLLLECGFGASTNHHSAPWEKP
jgi:hypothetical protein